MKPRTIPDTLLLTFSFLRAKELKVTSLVNKEWNQLSESEKLWKSQIKPSYLKKLAESKQPAKMFFKLNVDARIDHHFYLVGIPIHVCNLPGIPKQLSPEKLIKALPLEQKEYFAFNTYRDASKFADKISLEAQFGNNFIPFFYIYTPIFTIEIKQLSEMKKTKCVEEQNNYLPLQLPSFSIDCFKIHLDNVEMIYSIAYKAGFIENGSKILFTSKISEKEFELYFQSHEAPAKSRCAIS
jgi:hypothetical protein